MKDEDFKEVIETLEIKLKHLRNDYLLTKEEYENTTNKYLEILFELREKNEQLLHLQRNLEFIAAERAKQLQETEKMLEHKSEELQIMVDCSPAMIFYKDKKDRFVRVNKLLADTLGMSKEEIIGKTALEISPTKEKNYRKDDKQVIESGLPKRNIIELIETPGGPRWVQTDKIPYRDEKGEIQGIIGFSQDITERKKAEEQIQASLREKEILLQEIHHRVKNNLQVVSSLLNRKSKAIKDKKDAEVFQECRNFVRVMSEVHAELYQTKNLASINLKDYITTIAQELVRAYFPAKPDKVALKFEFEDVLLGIDSAIPLGLILNELITNSLKYAFPENRNGEIKVSLHARNENEVELLIGDNGIGLPKGLVLRKAETYGLHMITGLVEKQLHGRIEFPESTGTLVRITFSKD